MTDTNDDAPQGDPIDPRFSTEDWELLWNLLYNVTTNNAHLDRESGTIELDRGRADGMVLDPYPVEDIRRFDAMQEAVWRALGRPADPAPPPTLRFERDPFREEVGRTRWAALAPKWEWNGDATLASYFRPKAGVPMDPSVQEDADVPLGLYGDGVYRLAPYWERPPWPGPDWLEMSYGTACETVDLLPLLIGRIREPGVALRAARRLIELRSWCSMYWEHHVQSIEGDYELFEAFSAQHLLAQGDVPRRWDRASLNTLIWACSDDYREELQELTTQFAGYRESTLERHRSAPPPPLPIATEYLLARELVTALGLVGAELHPTLADWFC